MIQSLTPSGSESMLELEYGSAQDCQELGNFVGDLLSKRRYRWISRKKAIYCASAANSW